jgi:hypothetical protein
MRFLVDNIIIVSAFLCQVVRLLNGLMFSGNGLSFDHIFEAGLYSSITFLLVFYLAKSDAVINKIFVLGTLLCLILPFTAIDLGLIDLVEYPNKIHYIYSLDRLEVEKAICVGSIGWWSSSTLFQFFVKRKLKIVYRKTEIIISNNFIQRRLLYTVYFIASALLHLILTFKFKYYVAGVDTTLNLSGFVTYLLPVDFLFPLVSYFVYKARQTVKHFLLGEISLVLFVCLRMIQGWKGSIIDISLVFYVIHSRTKNQSFNLIDVFKLLIIFVIYKLFSPFVSIVRYIWIGSSGVNQFSTDYGFYSLVDYETISDTFSSSSLSMISRFSSIDPFLLSYRAVKDSANGSFSVIDLVVTFVEGLIPGKQFDNIGFNQMFSIICAGQSTDAINEYGAGVLGTGFLIGGYLGIYLYTFGFNAIYFFAEFINSSSKESIIGIYFKIVVPLQVIGMINGGGIHSLHKLVVAGVIFSAIESFLPAVSAVGVNKVKQYT